MNICMKYQHQPLDFSYLFLHSCAKLLLSAAPHLHSYCKEVAGRHIPARQTHS